MCYKLVVFAKKMAVSQVFYVMTAESAPRAIMHESLPDRQR